MRKPFGLVQFGQPTLDFRQEDESLYRVIDRGICRHGLQHFDDPISGEWLLHDGIVIQTFVPSLGGLVLAVPCQTACCAKVRKSSFRADQISRDLKSLRANYLKQFSSLSGHSVQRDFSYYPDQCFQRTEEMTLRACRWRVTKASSARSPLKPDG